MSFAATLALALSGCTGPAGERSPGALELGIRAADGSFQPLADGDAVPVSLGANTLFMIQPCLRSREIAATAPDPTVTVTVAGVVMAANLSTGERADMAFDGVGNVLWDLRVPFDQELCCYVCRQGRIDARVRDARGRLFEGSVSVSLERGGCPDPGVCCLSAGDCPDPSLTQVCD